MPVDACVAMWPRKALSSLPSPCSLEIQSIDVKEGEREGEKGEGKEEGRCDLLSKNLGSNTVLGSAVRIISFIFKVDIICIYYWNQARNVNDLPNVILEPVWSIFSPFHYSAT